MFEDFVKSFVRDRGYGPWYQYQAWEFLRYWSMTDLWFVYKYLDEKYPKLTEGDGD